MWGTGRKIRPSESQSDITWQASWCQTVTLGTDFSITPMIDSYILQLLPIWDRFLFMWETSISHDHVIDRLVLRTIHLKMGEKEPIMSKSMQDREISPSHLGKPRPWLKFLPLWWDFPILHGHSRWILIILQKYPPILPRGKIKSGKTSSVVYLWVSHVTLLPSGR